MPKKTGVVDFVFSKMRDTRKGKAKTYAIKMDDKWYNCGFTDPDVEEGATIAFNYKEGKYGFDVDLTTLQVVTESSEGSEPQAPSKGQSAKESLSREQYWANKEQRDIQNQLIISYQAARNSALSLTELVLSQDGLALPKVAKKRAEFLESFVDDLTTRFFRSANDVEQLKMLLADEVAEVELVVDDDSEVED